MIILETRSGTATQNMAEDWLMLEEFQDQKEQVRFRHYRWEKSAFTFGYSQSFDWVEEQAKGDFQEYCRRPTGGGIVDHRNDWTYSIVIPRVHAKFQLSPSTFYQNVHRLIGEALCKQGISTYLSPCVCDQRSSLIGVCFQEPSPMDVMHEKSGKKIAGAAMKRTKAGTLLQGSIDKGSVQGVDWSVFGIAFTQMLADYFNELCSPGIWPKYEASTVKYIHEMIGCGTWQRRR